MEDEDSDGVHEPVQVDELSFSWFLIKVVHEVQKLCRSDCAFLTRKDISYHVQLLLAFVIFIVAIVIGSIYVNICFNERMICVFLIVQGSCGLFVVFVHISAAVAE